MWAASGPVHVGAPPLGPVAPPYSLPPPPLLQARFVEDFATFLTEGQRDYKKINADQWNK